MNINPCLLMPQNWVIAFHRKCLASTMLIELFFVFALAAVSYCCSGTQTQKEEASLKMKEENVVRIEVIERSNMEEKSIMPLRQKEKHIHSRSNTTPISKQDQVSANKLQAVQQQSRPKQQQKPVIELKNLVLYGKDLKKIISNELGHQFICIAIAMMYFAFAMTTLVCFTQLILFMTHYLLRICNKTCLAKFTKSAFFLLNLPMLAFSVYGLCTNIPQTKLNSCYDL